MKISEFVSKYSDEISRLFDNHIDEKTFGVDTQDFDFGHDDITFEVEDEGACLNFTADYDEITILCSVDSGNLQDSLDDLKKIKDTDLREKVVVAIEEQVLVNLEDRIENSEATVEEAKGEHHSNVKEEASVKDSLRVLKDDWGVL